MVVITQRAPWRGGLQQRAHGTHASREIFERAGRDDTAIDIWVGVKNTASDRGSGDGNVTVRHRPFQRFKQRGRMNNAAEWRFILQHQEVTDFCQFCSARICRHRATSARHARPPEKLLSSIANVAAAASRALSKSELECRPARHYIL